MSTKPSGQNVSLLGIGLLVMGLVIGSTADVLVGLGAAVFVLGVVSAFVQSK